MIVSDERCAKFVAEQLGFGLCPPFTCMGIEKNGEIVAGVVFNHFEGADVHVSVAGNGWTRRFFREVGRYVFETLKCERMTAITEDAITATFAERLGGQHEGMMRNHYGPGRHGLIAGILREEWRY